MLLMLISPVRTEPYLSYLLLKELVKGQYTHVTVGSICSQPLFCRMKKHFFVIPLRILANFIGFLLVMYQTKVFSHYLEVFGGVM